MDQHRVIAGPGAGWVCRSGPGVFHVDGEPHLVLELLALLGSFTDPMPSDTVFRQLAQLLIAWETPPSALTIAVEASDGILLLVAGSGRATIASPAGPEELAAVSVAMWTQRVVPIGSTVEAGNGPDDDGSDSPSAAVRGGGFLLAPTSSPVVVESRRFDATPPPYPGLEFETEPPYDENIDYSISASLTSTTIDSAINWPPPPPDSAAPVAHAPTPAPAPEPIPVPAPEPTPAPGEVSTPVDTDSREVTEPVRIRGLLCRCGRLNSPGWTECRACGSNLAGAEITTDVRPPLAEVTLSDGRVFRLDRSVVVGRNPRPLSHDGRRECDTMVVASADKVVSRSHFELSVVEWELTLIDRGSKSGTRLRRVNQQELVLRNGASSPIGPGDEILFADQSATVAAV